MFNAVTDGVVMDFTKFFQQNDSVDIKRSAASFILKVKERNKLPQVCKMS